MERLIALIKQFASVSSEKDRFLGIRDYDSGDGRFSGHHDGNGSGKGEDNGYGNGDGSSGGGREVYDGFYGDGMGDGDSGDGEGGGSDW